MYLVHNMRPYMTYLPLFFPLNKMAACVLDGEKLCEVSGEVKWSNVERYNLEYCHGSLALYKLSTSFYIQGITKAKRVKVISVYTLRN